jgi:hypothetical protein
VKRSSLRFTFGEEKRITFCEAGEARFSLCERPLVKRSGRSEVLSFHLTEGEGAAFASRFGED